MRMLLEFCKGDTIRHLGLLDLQRTMQRALRRSGLPVAYSNGFNPHILMSFASALSSGIPGDAELVDVTLSEDREAGECLAAMKRALPPVMQPSRVRLVDDRFPKLGRLLTHAGYRFTVSGPDGGRLVDGLEAFLNQTEIMAVRKSKSAETLVNIRPMVLRLEGRKTESGAVIDAIVSFTEAATLKPDLLFATLVRETGMDAVPFKVRRTGLYTLQENRPVPLIEA